MFKVLRTVKKECPICESERDLQFGKRSEILKIRDETIAVKSKVYYCPLGNHYFHDIDDEEEKFQKAYREYRNRNNFLQPEDIKQIREKYGFSQRAFARFFGWGEITIQRYETGALQDFAHNSLLFFIKDFNNFKQLFEIRKNQLSKRDIAKIKKRLKEIESSRYQLTFNFMFKLTMTEKNKVPLKNFALKIKPIIPAQYIKTIINIVPVGQKGELALAA